MEGLRDIKRFVGIFVSNALFPFLSHFQHHFLKSNAFSHLSSKSKFLIYRYKANMLIIFISSVFSLFSFLNSAPENQTH